MILTTSPWGRPDSQREIAPGITHVTTGSHGGILVSPEQFASMPSCCQLRHSTEGAWYEEDCDLNLVILAFPQHFPDASIWSALNFVSSAGFPRDRYPGVAEYMASSHGDLARQRRQTFIDAHGHLYTRASVTSSKNGWHAYFSRIRDGLSASVADLQDDEVFGSSIFDLTRFGDRVNYAPA
jgi:hypothetical protein